MVYTGNGSLRENEVGTPNSWVHELINTLKQARLNLHDNIITILSQNFFLFTYTASLMLRQLNDCMSSQMIPSKAKAKIAVAVSIPKIV